MKRTGLIIILLAAVSATGQDQQTTTPAATQPEVARTNLVKRVNQPTESDMYCSGYITPQTLAKNSYIAAGWDSPEQVHYSDRNYVYLTGGSYNVGDKFAILRHTKDNNDYEAFPGQKRTARAVGNQYAELGRVRVLDVQKGIGIAEVELSCDAFAVGDLALPWADKPVPTFRRDLPINRFVQPNGMTIGRIVSSKDYDMLTADKHKVYLNVGESQGVKVGDYFRATRTYTDSFKDPNDSLSVKASVIEADQAKGTPTFNMKMRSGELPRKTLGEMIVLQVTPTSSTAMITRSLEQIYVGDGVEMMEPAPPMPEPVVTMAAPTVTCTASPATVRAGENSTIRCTGNSADDRPMTYTFRSDAGALTPRENVATLNTTNVQTGTVTVMTTVLDDRNLSGSTSTRVNVQAMPQAAEPDRMGEFLFRNNSAYVDNRAKALLDGVALRLGQEANSTVLLVGGVGTGEAARLAMARANNAKNYLVREKGVDASRILVRDGGATGRKVEVWFVPAGATAPAAMPAAPAQ